MARVYKRKTGNIVIYLQAIFYYALNLQNESGGWYGSYPAPGFVAKFYRGQKKPYYFPEDEISWAVKYFLDALALKEKLEFEKQAAFFWIALMKMVEDTCL